MVGAMPIWAYPVLEFVLVAAGFLIHALWRRAAETRGIAERCFALFATLVVAGCTGWIASASLARSAPAASRFALSAVSEGLIALAFSVLFLGTWRFFRPSGRAAAAGA